MPNLGQLNARVQSYLLDVPAAVAGEIDKIINHVIHRAQEKHRFRVMEATTQYTTVKETRKLTDKAGDWIESRGDPWLTDKDGNTTPMQWVPSEQDAVRAFQDNKATDKAEPTHLLEQATELWVYPYPDGRSTWADKEYRITVPYWRFLAALTTNDTNWFTENAEDMVVYGAVAEGFAMNFDEARYQFWGLTYDALHRPVGKAAVELARLIRVDKLSKLSRGFHVRPRAAVRGSFLQRRG